MANRYLKIVQVHSKDLGGGAEEMAYLLHKQFCMLGHDSYLLVAGKRRDDPRVIELSNAQRWRGEFRVKRQLEQTFGLQYLYAPASSRIQETVPCPDVMLIHSMHANTGYFDIADLPRITRRHPTFLFLHDQWLMNGHCAYSLGCDRWRRGCGKCPDLTISPALTRDGTRLNWMRKYFALRRSDLKVGSPAQWILDLARQSPLLKHFDQYHIPNGVDLEVFHSSDKRAARIRLGMDLTEQYILFVAQKGSGSTFKDFATLAEAFRILRKQGCSARLITVGGAPDGATRNALQDDVDFRLYTADRKEIADYYRAADIFCHATKADVCPLTILESQACGTPVIGTAIGGVAEIIVENVTGWTVPPGDAVALAARLSMALSDPAMLEQMSREAAAHAARNFGIQRIADRFVALFHSHLGNGKYSGKP